MKMIQYEMIQMLRNLVIPFFSLVFPLGMLYLITPAVVGNLKGEVADYARISVFTTIVQVIPLAVGFMGFASIYAQELESHIPFRLKMFGISEMTQLYAKMIVTFVMITMSYSIYVCIARFQMGVPQLTIRNVMVIYILIIAEMIGLMILAYAICLYFKKFGPSFTLVMFLYFVILFGAGMMGIRESNMSEFVVRINRFFPFRYVSNDMHKIFFNQSYNYMPLIQSLIFFIGLSCIICLAVIRFKPKQL